MMNYPDVPIWEKYTLTKRRQFEKVIDSLDVI